MPGNEKIHSLTEAFLWFLHGLRAATAAFSFISRQENRIVSETKMSWFRLFENLHCM